MEILEETHWDLLISGTGLRNSLLSLALSRSNKKILHIDSNSYYGDTDAALCLDELDDWAKKYQGPGNNPFRNAYIQKTTNSDELVKILTSRFYTITLSPFIIYSKSNLLSKLISSNAYRQLDFQAVGNWWLIDTVNEHKLQKIPNGREDIFQDDTIDNRSKRNLMKFLRFVLDYENQLNVWEAYSEKPLHEFLSIQFSIPFKLQKAIEGLTLTLHTPDQTMVSWALPRINRHLNSIGALGPGFSAVVSKWGCGAEISQIACRAGAVGGTVYMLSTGIEGYYPAKSTTGPIEVKLSNGCVVKTNYLLTTPAEKRDNPQFVSRMIAITTSSYQNLLKSNIDGAPMPAVVVVVFPSGSLTGQSSITHQFPVYIMVHSSDTGECPDGQNILYATTLASANSKNILETALIEISRHADNRDGNILYSLYYEFTMKSNDVNQKHDVHEQPVDLAFNDQVINDVEAEWQEIMGSDGKSEAFMNFDDRDSMPSEDDETSG